MFVFAVVGDRHLQLAALATRYLKKFSRADILVVCARSDASLGHDQVLRLSPPAALDDHRASIWLKTGLYQWTLPGPGVCCYVDSDVIAVRDDVDDIFRRRRGAVNFAQDHTTIDQFSRLAVRCGCESGGCGHLREAIEHHFGIFVPEGRWQMWNGGVFLYDRHSVDFLSRWNELTLKAFTLPYWRTRDQGTLAATAWELGCARQSPLPGIYNFLVDRMRGVPEQRRPTLPVSDYSLRSDYALGPGTGKVEPRMIHFINGGVGCVGWPHWDEVQALLGKPMIR